MCREKRGNVRGDLKKIAEKTVFFGGNLGGIPSLKKKKPRQGLGGLKGEEKKRPL